MTGRPKIDKAVAIENIKAVAAALGVTRLGMKEYVAHPLHRFHPNPLSARFGWRALLTEAGLRSTLEKKERSFTECPRCRYPKPESDDTRCPKCQGLVVEDVEATLEGIRIAVRCANCGWRPMRREADLGHHRRAAHHKGVAA